MIKDWINIKQRDELEEYITKAKCGEKVRGFDLVRKTIKADICEFQRNISIGEVPLIFNMGSKSKDGLLEKIRILRLFLKQENIRESENNYFKDDVHELLYYLIELDGKERMEKLKAYEGYFYNRELAKEWYRDIVKKIHPDKLEEEEKKLAEIAMINLKAIYMRMKGDGR